MRNRRWGIIAGLGVVQLWIIGLILRSISGGHGPSVEAALPRSALSSPAPRSEAGSRTVDTGPDPQVIVDDDGVALTVTARPGARVSVREHSRRCWLFGTAPPVDIEQTADGVRISQGQDGAKRFFGSFDRRLEVIVPPRARVDVRNAGSTVAAGLRADASFHSDDGSVTVSDHRGDVQVTTDNGRIELRDVAGPLVQTSSDNGRISFDRVRAERVAVSTDNGRIEIARSLLGGGKIQTDNGRVTLGLDPQSDVTVTARAAAGKVLAESPLIATEVGEDDDTPAIVRIGSGAGRLDVGSGDGSISIRAGGV